MDTEKPSNTSLDEQLDELAGEFESPDSAPESHGQPVASEHPAPGAATASGDTEDSETADADPGAAAGDGDGTKADDLTAADADSDVAGDFESPSEVAEDLSGSAFADQVQAMLDEADLLAETPPEPRGADADPTADEPGPDPAGDSSEARPAAAVDSPDTDAADSEASDADPAAATATTSGDVDGDPDASALTDGREGAGAGEDAMAGDDLLNQIDDMLADAANDTLDGAFESLEGMAEFDDEADADEPAGQTLPPHPDELTGKSDPGIDPEGAAGDAADESEQPTPDAEANAENAEQTAAMNRLAEELDAAESEALATRMQDKAVLDPDDPEPTDPSEAEAANPNAGAPAARPVRVDRRRQAMALLSRINAPVNRLSPDLRAAVGLLALGNLFFGLGLLCIAALLG